MGQGCESRIHQRSMLRSRCGAQAVKELRYTRLGNIVLFDAGLDVGDELDFRVEGLVAAQDGRQVGDLLIGKLGVGHELVG